MRNVEHLMGSGRFVIAQQDVVQPLAFEVDEIYNLACAASPAHYQKDPIGTLKTSVFGASSVLELAKQRGIRVLQASTSEVYGDPIEHPQEERHWGRVNPVGPRACYDEGKRCAEAMFFDYWRVHSVQIKIIRIFNTYGPRMHPADGRVVSNFICQALRNADITIYGDGSQTRSLCYVEDLVQAMVRMMGTGPEVTGPINTGNPEELTILELAELVLEMVNSRSKLIRVPLPVDDPRQRRPDISKAREVLGWEPRVTLRDGLAQTIGYFEELVRSAV